MSSKRWTKNPTLPKRYRPGKGDDGPSDDDDYSDEEEEQVQEEQQQSAPTLGSLPSRRTAAQPTPRRAVAQAAPINEDEFETESEGEDDGQNKSKARRVEGAAGLDDQSDEDDDESSEGEESSGEEESESETSSEDEAPKLLRPTFIRKDQREKATATTSVPATSAPPPASGSEIRTGPQIIAAQSSSNEPAELARRQADADAVVREQIEKQAAARAAGKKYWDDDDDNLSEADVDDTDGLDPEAELAAWKLRELKRVKRARDAIEQAEKEREEVERRRGLTAEEREREDAEHLEAQKQDREGRGQAGYMKRYFHRGAFYQGGGDGDDDKDQEAREMLRQRDIMGARFADETNREVLPEYMQIRDMTKLGRKGRTRYKDLRSEDTGRWGQDLSGPRRERWQGDDRFAPDDDYRFGGGARGPERSGANAAPVGDRRPYQRRSRSRSRESRKRSRSPAPYRDSYRDEKRQRRAAEA